MAADPVGDLPQARRRPHHRWAGGRRRRTVAVGPAVALAIGAGGLRPPRRRPGSADRSRHLRSPYRRAGSSYAPRRGGGRHRLTIRCRRGCRPIGRLRSVPEFLSPEWIDALDRAARGAHPRSDAAAPTVDYVRRPRSRPRATRRRPVTTSPTRRTGSGCGLGPPRGPDLAFVTNRSTAYALHTGGASARRTPFGLRPAEGLKGDLNVLAGARPVLTALDDVFGAVRAETTPAPGGYEPEPAEPEVGPMIARPW